MTKDILELVKNNNRVILPNFGAFIISKENGFSVLFNNFLSFNDGLLVNHIAKKKNIDSNQALDQVNQFVDSIKQSLDNTGLFEIIGLGKFTKDSNGILRFIQDSDTDSISNETSSHTTTQDLLDIVPAGEAINTSITNDNDSPLTTPRNTTNDQLLSIDNEPTQVAPPVVNTSTRTEKTTTTSNNTMNVNKKRSPKWIILLLLLLIIGGGVYYFGWVKPIQFSFFGKKKTDTTLVAPIPVKTVETPAPVDTQSIATRPVLDKKFYIIVATLKNEQQANDHVNKLKEKGFSNALVLPHGEKYLVSIDAEENLISADARQEEIVNQYRIESYVLTIK